MGGVCLSACWDTAPPRYQGGTHPETRHPPDQAPPPDLAPPPTTACWEIRSTSGRCASYWNVFLMSYARTLLILRLRYSQFHTHRRRHRHRPRLASLPPDYHPHPELPLHHPACPHHHHRRRRRGRHYPEMHNVNSILKLFRTQTTNNFVTHVRFRSMRTGPNTN